MKNKFLMRIIGAALGLSMAIGTGVAIGASMSSATGVSATTATITINYGDTFSPALPSASGSVNTSATSHTDTTASDFAFKEVGIYKGSSNSYLMFVKNSGYLYNTSSLGTITKVTATYTNGTSTDGKTGVYFGDSEQSTYTSTSNATIKGQSKTDEWTNSQSGYGFFQLSTSNKNVQITQITITYDDGSGGSGGDTDGTATCTPTSASAATLAGSYPTGSQLTFSNTYTNTYTQMTKGSKQTYTLTNFGGNKITSLKTEIKRNSGGGGTGEVTVKNGTTALISSRPFTKNDISTSNFTDYEVLDTNETLSITDTNSLVIIIEATENSLHCDKVTIVWEVDTIKYSVTYDGNGKTSGSVPTDSTKYESGDTVTVADNSGNLAKTGYTFGGWNTKADGTGTNYTAGSGTFEITENTTLYAKWNINSYTVTFNMKGHGTAPADQSIQHGGKVTKPSDPTATGYTFGGWFKETDLTNEWDFTNDTVTAATILYAKWTKNSYTVNGEGVEHGSLSDDSNIDYDEDLAINIVPDTGYGYPTEIEVTMGGSDITDSVIYDPDDGSILYEGVSGNIVITAECPATSEIFDIVVSCTNCTYSGPETISEEGEAEVAITPNSDYKLPSAAVVNETTYITVENAIEWSYSNGTISILGATDDVAISITCPALENYTITVNETNGSHTGDTSIQENGNATLTFTPALTYGQPSTVTVSGATESWNSSTGVLTLTNPTGNVTVTYAGVANELSSIELSSTSGDYELGDKFTLPTVTAHFTVADDNDVTDDVIVTGSGLENGYFTSTGEKTLTISYTYGNETKTATYTATVTAVTTASAKYTKVTSAPSDWSGTYLIVYEGDSSNAAMDGTATTNSGAYKSVTISNSEIAATSTINTYAYTIAKGTTDNTKYTVRSASGYYIDRPTSGSGGGLTVSNSTAYELSIAYVTDHVEIRASCYNASQNVKQQLEWNNSSSIFKFYNNTQQDIQLYRFSPAVEKTFKWITAEVNEGDYYQNDTVTASDFTVTAHYNDGSASVVTDDITVTNGKLNNIGSNTVTLTYGGESCQVVVTAAERAATLDGIVWSLENEARTVFDGATIGSFGTLQKHFSDASTPTLSLDDCDVAMYTSKDVSNKDHDIDDPTTYTWDIDEDNGLYLGVTYSGYTKFSDVVTVVKTLNDIYAKEETYTFSGSNIATSLSVGDIVVMAGTKADGAEPSELTSVSGNIGVRTAFTTDPSGTYQLEIVEGNTTGSIAFKDSDGYYLSSTTDKSLSLSATCGDSESWTVTFDSTNTTKARVINVDSGDPLQYNPGSRFCVYSSDSQQPLVFYKGIKTYVPTGDSMANTDAVTQQAVLDFVTTMNTQLAVCNGTTGATNQEALKGAWGAIKTAYDTAKTVEGVDGTLFENMLKYATSSQAVNADDLQLALARYDYIITKYGTYEDFLGRVSAGSISVTSPRTNITNPFSLLTSDTSSMVIVIISVVSLASIGGYFFLRKRKEY